MATVLRENRCKNKMFCEHMHISLSRSMAAWSSLSLSNETILQTVFDSSAESDHADNDDFSLEVEDWEITGSDRRCR